VAFIELSKVEKTFVSRKGVAARALSDISLSVDHGEFVTIVGRSGCGKSTLLRLISGLVDRSEGSISVAGRDVRAQAPDVGFVFQQPVLLPWKNVLDNVLFAVEMLSRSRAKNSARERAHELLELAGLGDVERRYPSELSGGMQQRVAICRALITDPPLLLMDEPFGALDALTREEMSFHLLRLWEAAPKTILFVTHSISEAVLLADRVLVMAKNPGRVVREIPIGLERPRRPDHEFGQDFDRYAREVRELLFERHESAGTGGIEP
jgi:NitT/TauT family transport system ATP-binding protein